MPDDLDNQLRAAMKTLDDQVPSGYFEAVPNQILARLEDGSMQSGSGSTDIRNNKLDALMGPPVVPEESDTNPTPKVEASGLLRPAPLPTAEAKSPDREEDSGLHDIRNLAQSTKQRLSSRRITMNPPVSDDALASSSGSFAGIALPQPAHMVSLPDIEDLPSKQEVIAAQKAAAKARKAKPESIAPLTASKDVLAPQATANAAIAAMSAAPVAAESVPARQAFSLPSMEQKRSKGPLIAIVGLGVAAAAGGLLFMNIGSDKSAASSAPVAAVEQKQAPTAEPIVATGSAAPAAAPAPVEPAVVAPVVEEKPADVVAAKEEPKTESTKRGAGRAKKGNVEVEAAPKAEDKKVEVKPDPKADKKPPGGEGEPSFDALLKEAGVDDKKPVAPKLEKKSLSGDDFKKGMAAINGKAQGCYKGTQGTASVKLTIAASGAVTKASVGGQFAGTPEGACVEAAVKGATFPAWDGGPQSFNFSYMLSD